jgi:glycosyltransferase involved in cell wall biosynthesis
LRVLHGVRVVVVVPSFEVAPHILGVVRTMPPEVDHVIVVDDGSLDGTAEVARGANDPRVEVLSHARNRGVGAAITTGYLRGMELTEGARDVLVVMAGDGQMDPADLPRLVEPIARGRADYAKGCRFDWPGVREQMPTARFIGGWVFSALTSRAVGQPIRDSQCGYTALSREAAAALDLRGLWPRYGYPNDILGQLAARGLVIAEAKVRPIYAGEVSRLKVRHLPAIAGLIARAWVRRRAAGR